MINRVVLIGRLTKDPELRYTPNGVATCTFTLAVERPSPKDREKAADFISIVVWRQLAEICASYLKKGRLTGLEGRLQVRNYDGKDGKKVYVTEVLGDKVQFLESGKNESRQEQPPAEISADDLPF